MNLINNRFYLYHSNNQIAPKSASACTSAKEGTIRATEFSKTAVFNAALNEIQKQSVEQNEFSISFGKDSFGRCIKSIISSESRKHTAKLKFINQQFADVHNHTNNLPPSSGDIYGFIDLALQRPQYIRYIITSDSSIYALILTQLSAAIKFNNKYPRNPGIYGFQPGFPQKIVDEINKMKGWWGATEEATIAFILEKYNTGIALLKQNKKGNFKKLVTKKDKNNTGKIFYTAIECE